MTKLQAIAHQTLIPSSNFTLASKLIHLLISFTQEVYSIDVL